MRALTLACLALLFACDGGGSADKNGGGGGNDLDDDGYGGDNDCDDESSAIYPGAQERCNGIDDDCDGAVDEAGAADGVASYPDADGDGWGADEGATVCPGEAGYVAAGGDCDDTTAEVSPEAEELCDSIDNDCDGLTDEPGTADGNTYYLDRDDDGYGHPTQTGVACAAGEGYVENNTDCDDGDPTRNPSATELCLNEQDDDCDGEIDEADGADLVTWYLDADGDGYGTGESTQESCTHPDGYSALSSDCDDGNEDINPGAPERTDEIDNDCDGEIDEGGSDFDGTLTGVNGECHDVWQTHGTPMDASCEGCAWAYEVTFTYDEDASEHGGWGCWVDSLGERFVWDLAFSTEYGWGSYDALMIDILSLYGYYYYGDEEYWYPLFLATWDDDSGELVWWWEGYGYYDYDYDYDYGRSYFYYSEYTLYGLASVMP